MLSKHPSSRKQLVAAGTKVRKQPVQALGIFLEGDLNAGSELNNLDTDEFCESRLLRLVFQLLFSSIKLGVLNILRYQSTKFVTC